MSEINELKSRIEWMETGLNKIIDMINKNAPIDNIKVLVLIALEGEPTSADEYNKKYLEKSNN